MGYTRTVRRKGEIKQVRMTNSLRAKIGKKEFDRIKSLPKSQRRNELQRLNKIVNGPAPKRTIRSGSNNRNSEGSPKSRITDKDYQTVHIEESYKDSDGRWVKTGEVIEVRERADNRYGDPNHADYKLKQASKFKKRTVKNAPKGGPGKFQRGRYAGGLDKRHYCPGKSDPSKKYAIDRFNGRVRKKKERNRTRIHKIHQNHVNSSQKRIVTKESDEVLRVFQIIVAAGGKKLSREHCVNILCVNNNIPVDVVNLAYSKLFQ